MRFKSKIVTLCLALGSAALLTSCDINPNSPVLDGDTGESSNEKVGTILPDPPPENPSPPQSHDKKKERPEVESPKPQEEQALEKGPE